MKTCFTCKVSQALEEFNKCKITQDGKQSNCKTCQKRKSKEWYAKNKEHHLTKTKAWTAANFDKHKEIQKDWRLKNKEDLSKKGKEYREANKDKEAARLAAWYAANKEKAKASRQAWQANNRDKKNALWTKRHALKLKAVPAWADHEKIKDMYRQAKELESQDGIIRNVDHIIPLQGKYVCGFHIAENLQILTATENFSKSNSFTPYVESEGNPNQF